MRDHFIKMRELQKNEMRGNNRRIKWKNGLKIENLGNFENFVSKN